MTLGSLFDGSGGFPLAGALAGIEPVWAAEVEPYPIAVTRSRFPKMQHLGSVTGVHGDKVQPVDVITFGSPCQDLSVAGKRAGIHDGQRSNLFFEAIRIIKEMREATNGRYPAFAVWENVPGAFSSNKGEDFRCVLENFAKINEGGYTVPRPANGKWMGAGEIVGDGFSAAWRVLDAQYWGVPQRRRRIYLVADFAGGRAGKILFERESLRGHPAACGAPGQGAAANATRSAGGSRGIGCLNPWDCQSKRIYQPDGVYPTLPAMDCGGANNQAVLYTLDSMSSNSIKSSNPHSGFHAETVAKTLQAGGVDPTCNQGGNVIVMERCAGFMGGQGSKAGGLGYSEEVAPTLKATPSGGNTIPDVVYAINDKATRYRGGGVTRNDDGAGNGLGVQDNGAMYTLDTASRHAVCYPETARYLTARHDGSPCADRGPDVICYSAGFNDATGERAQGSMEYCEECSQTLRAGNVKSVVYDARGNGDGIHCPTLTGDHENRVTDYTALCIGHGEPNSITMAEQANTLTCMHDQQAVLTDGKPPRRYIIRRLTPLECNRLQGFPDGWGIHDHKGRLSDDELVFWQGVRDTCAGIAGKPPKKYSAEALTKWYNGLHTDSAEYKMWGNGIALPCAEYVMEGIAEELKEAAQCTKA